MSTNTIENIRKAEVMFEQLKKECGITDEEIDAYAREEDAKENLQLYMDRENGATYSELADKYGIRIGRAREIYMKVAFQEEYRKSEFFHRIERLAPNERMAIRTIKVLQRAGIDTLEKAQSFADGDFRKLRGCGSAMNELIKNALAVTGEI